MNAWLLGESGPMKSFCFLVLTQPVGVHGIPNAVPDSPGLSSFEELFLLSPHLHLAESVGFLIEGRLSCIVRSHPLGSCDCSHDKKEPQNRSWNQLKGVQGISKGDCSDPSAIAEHADEEVTEAVDCTNETATKNMRFDQQPEISED